MLSVLQNLAGITGEPLVAEPVLKIFGLTITNSMFFGVITALAVLVIFSIAAARSRLRPHSSFSFAIEQLVQFILGVALQNFSTKKQAYKHLPLLLTLFVFILVSNLSGLLPGVGTVNVHYAGQSTPLLRAFTTDLNATLALGVMTIFLVQFYAITELGIVTHLKHYFTDKPLNPMNFFIGVIEVFSELIRIVTLAMRLFGVIYAGEVLINVLGSLGGNFGWATMLPVYLMEIFFSIIQAYIFVMLTTVYIANATTHSDTMHEDLGESERSSVVPKRVVRSES